jgi:hypothetical protein
MTGLSNGNSFNGSSNFGAGDAPVRRIPPWKFGVGPAAMSDDRGSI